MSAISLRVCVSLAAWFWLTAKTMDFPISPLTGSRSAFSKNVLQKTWLVESEKKRFSNSLCLNVSSCSSPVSSVKETTKPWSASTGWSLPCGRPPRWD